MQGNGVCSAQDRPRGVFLARDVVPSSGQTPPPKFMRDFGSRRRGRISALSGPKPLAGLTSTRRSPRNEFVDCLSPRWLRKAVGARSLRSRVARKSRAGPESRCQQISAPRPSDVRRRRFFVSVQAVLRVAVKPGHPDRALWDRNSRARFSDPLPRNECAGFARRFLVGCHCSAR